MLEIISDMTMLWISVVVTVLLVAAFTRASMSVCEWTIRANWKNQFKQIEPHDKIIVPTGRLFSKSYHPKIPSFLDQSVLDDEEPFLVRVYA
ncbi:hypothetical protein [Halalkalibacter urbisdiaboli]|uniref:hypothetical protein n=1 Tax=Halalkalibacter urbisdiaboli TaxID=1960589 RepID=UPI000B43C46E|nr:hypothetical protein [Halalkalibacter urbisdiaboli]